MAALHAMVLGSCPVLPQARTRAAIARGNGRSAKALVAPASGTPPRPNRGTGPARAPRLPSDLPRGPVVFADRRILRFPVAAVVPGRDDRKDFRRPSRLG